jgi:methylase of polypeptide subunit release factors
LSESAEAAAALEALLRRAESVGYRFTTVTPETHALLNARAADEPARSLRDIFGWNRSFSPDILPRGWFELMLGAGACQCENQELGLWRATLRIASLGDLLFAHSAFPTLASDAVFFGPDSYRFARAIRQRSPLAKRAVDVGCGSGVGGIMLASLGRLQAPVVLADINDRALELARVNARAAGIRAEVVNSDVLRDVEGSVDLVIANPPYLVDPTQRAYRHGGRMHGAELSARIARESLARLDRDGGGTLLLYTGVAIIDGSDPLLASLRDDLQQSGAVFSYEEVDPDIFGSELREPAYADAERIAAVLLEARLGK